jgi:hypothetical protein
MATTSVIALRARELTERDVRQLAARLASRGVVLAPDAATLARDLQAGARAICGLLDKLNAVVGFDNATRFIAEIRIGEA